MRRRKYLQTTVAFGIGSIAGCSGNQKNDPGNGTTDSPNGQTTEMESTLNSTGTTTSTPIDESDVPAPSDLNIKVGDSKEQIVIDTIGFSVFSWSHKNTIRYYDMESDSLKHLYPEQDGHVWFQASASVSNLGINPVQMCELKNFRLRVGQRLYENVVELDGLPSWDMVRETGKTNSITKPRTNRLKDKIDPDDIITLTTLYSIPTTSQPYLRWDIGRKYDVNVDAVYSRIDVDF